MDVNSAFSPGMSRHSAPSDSRLLGNLIKAERTYIGHLRSSVNAAHGASSALSAWGTSEAADVADASARLANLLAACTEVQNTHVAAIEGYRGALKDVADREATIRTVVRDRDILVGRLIKASQKSANSSSKKTPEERAERVAKAQRELAACEEVLAMEEAALVGVKRRTFKEALTMRMKTMGDAGAAMVDAAKEAIMLLDAFDSNAYQMPISPSGYDGAFAGSQDGEEGMTDAYQYPQRQYHNPEPEEGVNHPGFENSSVTPSQSASQVQHGQTQPYNAPFEGIAEGEGLQLQAGPQDDEYDSDVEDWQRSFGVGEQNIDQRLMVHRGGGAPLPAPHQLDTRAGAETDFVPQAASGPPPPTPAKDDEKRQSRALSLKKGKGREGSIRDGSSQLNYVPMPPIPSAPRLDANGINMGAVPTAPKLYMHGAANEDSSDDEGPQRNMTSHRGGGAGGWQQQNGRGRGDGSSDEGTARISQVSARKKGGFFGRMGRLFKGEERKQPSSIPQPLPRPVSQSWDTRTDSNVRNSQRMNDSLGRRPSVMRTPLVAQEEDSSDDEMVDESKLVRHVNKGPPLWQSSKGGSDVGASKSLVAKAVRPASLKRTPSASINAGPLSWKAHQEASSRGNSEAGSTFDAPLTARPSTLSRSNTATSTATSVKKKKKKTSSIAGGSELGTTATRSKTTTTPSTLPSSTSQRHSIVVAGDASSGIRRSDSLNQGSIRGAQDSLSRRASKRLSAMSTHTVHGYGSKSGAVAAPDPSGKFATNNWVAKSNIEEEPANGSAAPTAHAATNGPIRPTARHAAAPTPVSKPAPSARKSEPAQEPPKHVPQPSRTMSPPPKSALKPSSGASDLVRTASAMSNASTGAPKLPMIPAPISAPPPASTLLDKDTSIDGSGRLHLDTTLEEEGEDANASAPAATSPRTPLPRIEMPSSEPFRVELEQRGKSASTSQSEARPSGMTAGDPLMTPNEQHAYNTFLSAHGDDEESAKREQPSTLSAAPDGVTRTTVARASVGSGVMGPKNVPPPASSVATEESNKLKATPMPPRLSRSYSGEIPLSDESSDEEEETMQAQAPAKAPAMVAAPSAIKKPASILSTSHLHANGDAAHDRSPEGSGVGSTVSRRKSVRMAPDVKMPPETPPGEAGHHHRPTPPSKLSSRIAPPPPAPARVTASHTDRPIDLDNMRDRPAWSTRIGMSRNDDSSDDDADGVDGNDYAAARKNFGSISKSWGKAMGRPESTKASSTTGSKKKKRQSTQSNSGYNPAIPLPAGMEVVGRSSGRR